MIALLLSTALLAAFGLMIRRELPKMLAALHGRSWVSEGREAPVMVTVHWLPRASAKPLRPRMPQHGWRAAA